MRTKISKKPLVSIVIPVFNEEKYIASCLDSLRNQTYQNSEIIVVDDGSTDETGKIVKTYEVTYLMQDHRGPGKARNLGASQAKGEILAFLDADMKFDTKYIQNLIQPIQRGEVGSFHKEKVANGRNIWSKCWSINADLAPGMREREDMPTELNVFRAISRDAFERVRGFDPRIGYADDTTLSEKLKKKAVLAPGAVAYHFNPSTLYEVFVSSRWIGRGETFRKSLSNALRYNIVNSLRNGLRKVKNGAPVRYIVFKIVYDFGMFCGIFFSFGKRHK